MKPVENEVTRRRTRGKLWENQSLRQNDIHWHGDDFKLQRFNAWTVTHQ